MSIRRISELPNIQTLEQQYGIESGISNCLFEVSYTPDDGNQYRSAYMKGGKLTDYILKDMNEKPLSNIMVCGDVNVHNGKFNLVNSILELSDGSSILAWPNEPTDGHETCCYLHFDHIKMSSDHEIDIHSDGQLKLEGNPVVINNNLTVHTNNMTTNQQVNLQNNNNIIQVQPVATTVADLTRNQNRVVTCGMLNDTIVYFSELVNKYDRGVGVDWNKVPSYTLTLHVNPEGRGTTEKLPSGPYYSGQAVKITATPVGEDSKFLNWSGDISDTKNPCYVFITKNTTISANFSEEPTQQIEVTKYGCNSSTGKPSFTTVPKNCDISPKPAAHKLSPVVVTYTFSKEGYPDLQKSYKFEKKESTSWSATKSLSGSAWEIGQIIVNQLSPAVKRGEAIIISRTQVGETYYISWQTKITVSNWNMTEKTEE